MPLEQNVSVPDRRKDVGEIKPVDEVLITARQLRARWGGISTMTLHRRQKDPSMPKAIRLGGLRMWRVSEIAAYEWLLAVRGGA